MTGELRSAVKIGLLGGLAAWHVSLVGMLETFAARRLIGTTITLGYALLVALILLVGYLAARRAARPRQALGYGLVAGGMVGLAVSALALLVAEVNLRPILLAASPRLVQLLTLGRGIGVGLLFPLIGGLGFGLLGGGLAVLPPLWQRTIATAVVTTVLVGLLRDVLVVVLPNALNQVLFSRSANSGLTVLGAVIVLLLTGAAVWGRAMYQPAPRKPTPATAARRLAVDWHLAPLALLGVVLLTFPLWGGLFLSNVADFVGFFVIMGLGLNLVVGFAGLLDLGYVAFYAIGAYTMAVLTSPDLGLFELTFWEALPFSMLAAMLAGVLLGLPVLRMRGDYLAITTLGFGEIIRILALSDFLKPYIGGAQGVTRIARPQIGGFVADTPQEFYYLILAGCLLAWFIAARLKTSRLGRAWMAIREDEDVAQAMGINRVTAKLTAFALGAFLGGLSGALFASMVNSVVPRSFELLISINVLALIIVGGMGSLPGVVVGALALVGLPELLREFREYRLLVYGVVLVVMMLYRPEGLWPEARVARELHETEEESVAEEIPAAVPRATPPREAGTPPVEG
jgi:branched-chain amino acid transport system permease protein